MGVSQSAWTAEGGLDRGFDGKKKVTGRKRHIIVDTLGMIMVVMVHTASFQDDDAGHFLLHRIRIRETFRRLKVVFGQSAYGKSGLPEWSQQTCRVILQTVLRPVEANGFVVLPMRWIIERTFAWLGRQRRLSKDDERLPGNSEATIDIAMINLMSKRLANAAK